MSYQYVFVTGAPKSGTTWLGAILDAHPEISCRGESCVHFFGQKLTKAFKEYDEHLEQRRTGLGELNGFPPLTKQEFNAVLRVFIENRMLAVAKSKNGHLKFLGDKDPGHLPHMLLMNDVLSSVKFIHLIRDGRDVAISAWNHNQWSLQKQPFSSFDEFLLRTAGEWKKYVSNGREQGRRLGPDKYLEVRYCDLVLDTPGLTRRILSFIGADTSETRIDECVESGSFERLSKGRKPGEEDSKSFFRKGVAGEWRRVLSAKQLHGFNGIAGDFLQTLGYDLYPDGQA